MQWKALSVALGCLASGLLIAVWVRDTDDRARRGVQDAGQVAVINASAEGAMPGAETPLPAANPQQTGPTPIASSASSAPPSVEVAESFFANLGEQARDHAAQRYKEQLSTAGLSPQRIEWLNARSDELYKAVREGLKSGKYKTTGMSLSYALDPDLDLRNEIGEEEYDLYRQALGRSAGVGIKSIPEGSTAGAAGLMVNDQVLRYSGERVYNEAMLNLAVFTRGSGGTAVLDVLRDGQRIQLVVPGGSLGFEAAPRGRRGIPIPRE